MAGLSRTSTAGNTGYGARPVSVDLARNHRLTQTADREARLNVPGRSAQPGGHRVTQSQVSDQLALAHWPADQLVAVCSLAGGVGRTTVAGLFALTLAGLPYAQLHRPVALGELDPSPLSQSRIRWGVPPDLDHVAVTQIGGRVRILADITAPADGRPIRVIDSPAGLTATLGMATSSPATSIVLLTRPDPASLADAAAALIWLQDVQGVERQRLTVVINHGSGPGSPGSKAAATALGIRCRSIHRLPAHTALGPGTPLPSGRQMPRTVQRALLRVCADVYNSTRPATTTSPHTLPEEDSHA